MRIQISVGQSVKLVSTGVGRKGFSIQNVGPTDIFYSDDQRLLDTVDSTNLPIGGHLLPATNPVSPPIVYPQFKGVLFARAQATGAQLEIVIYDVEKC